MKFQENKINGVSFIHIDNEHGLFLNLCSFGASVFELKVINKDNKMETISLTPSSLNTFYYNSSHYGKTAGRFAGRIDDAKCEINGVTYTLDKNWNKINALHGGNNGIAFENFKTQIIENEETLDVIFTLLEKENKLPGDVSYEITYKVSKLSNEYTIYFDATTTKDTLVNLTNHTYFNLSGDCKETILNHTLKLNCNKYTRLNNNLITESIEPVNEVMDFTKGHHIGQYINDPSLINHTAFGYDHCFLKTNKEEPEVAIYSDDVSKRRMTVLTSYPSIVCYTCNYPGNFEYNDNNIHALKHQAICLECQFVPNGINMNDVDKAILRKNEKYHHYITYKFDIMD